MHKLNRPSEPPAFKSACEAFKKRRDVDSCPKQRTRLKAFKRTYNLACKEACQVLVDNQHGLCAFCEAKLDPKEKQMEHFIPISLSTPDDDWICCFENLTVSCISPDCCGHKKSNSDPKDNICNPYALPEFSIFKADQQQDGLHLVPDEKACQTAQVETSMVISTIKHLGLNCPDLVRSRQEIWDILASELDEILDDPATEKESELAELAHSHLEPDQYGQRKGFYTTRWLCLKK